MNLNSIDLKKKFPDLPPKILEIANELQVLILVIFPTANQSYDDENIGFGSGYKDMVFVISPKDEHVNLGIPYGATLEDPKGLMQGKGKIHRHVKISQVGKCKNLTLSNYCEWPVELPKSELIRAPYSNYGET